MPPSQEPVERQLCHCGHIKIRHRCRSTTYDDHGGPCNACDCKQFTLRYTVYPDGTQRDAPPTAPP